MVSDRHPAVCDPTEISIAFRAGAPGEIRECAADNLLRRGYSHFGCRRSRIRNSSPSLRERPLRNRHTNMLPFHSSRATLPSGFTWSPIASRETFWSLRILRLLVIEALPDLCRIRRRSGEWWF